MQVTRECYRGQTKDWKLDPLKVMYALWKDFNQGDMVRFAF